MRIFLSGIMLNENKRFPTFLYLIHVGCERIMKLVSWGVIQNVLTPRWVGRKRIEIVIKHWFHPGRNTRGNRRSSSTNSLLLRTWKRMHVSWKIFIVSVCSLVCDWSDFYSEALLSWIYRALFIADHSTRRALLREQNSQLRHNTL